MTRKPWYAPGPFERVVDPLPQIVEEPGVQRLGEGVACVAGLFGGVRDEDGVAVAQRAAQQVLNTMK